jgi:hypothetical protein
MHFVALPTAGQGLLAKKMGALTWLEQMALHVVLAPDYGDFFLFSSKNRELFLVTAWTIRNVFLFF